MKPSLKRSIILALVVLQFTHAVYSQQQQQQDQNSGNAVSGQQQSTQQQQQQQQQTSNAATATSAPITETLAPAVPTTTEAAQPTATQAPESKADTTVEPTTTTAAPITSDTTVPTSSTDNSNNNTRSESRKGVQQTPSAATSNDNPASTGTTSRDRPQATESSSGAGSKDDSGSSKTAVIAGSVVGGLVGVAVIAGLLTWMNRRGGCTSRTRRRNNAEQDFTNDDNDQDNYKMTDNSAGLGATMQSTDNISAPSPFQHARRFVPPTSSTTGYMNLQDEEYGYHQNSGYQPQQYHDLSNVYHDPDYSQDYQHYGEYAAHDYSVNGSQQQAFYSHAPGSNVTSPTLTNSAPLPPGQHMKPDQVEQKPNVA